MSRQAPLRTKTDPDRWRLGTCVPAGLLDCDGYLSRHQKRLTRLSLVTDGTCPHAQHGLEGLSALNCLTALEWEGLQHPAEVESLRQCIRRNEPSLNELAVGFVPSAVARDLRWESLGIRPSISGSCAEGDCDPIGTTVAPALHILSLSKISLPPTLSTSGSSIFCSLRSLTLLDCPNQLRLLRSLSRTSPIQLDYFEICVDFLLDKPGEEHDSAAVVLFLRSFRGLRHLHLKLSNFPASEPRMQDAIRHHRPTLESLIYHERQLMPIDDDGFFEDDRDISPGWIASIPDVVDLRQITALALCVRPPAAVRYRAPTRGLALMVTATGSPAHRNGLPNPATTSTI